MFAPAAPADPLLVTAAQAQLEQALHAQGRDETHE